MAKASADEKGGWADALEALAAPPLAGQKGRGARALATMYANIVPGKTGLQAAMAHRLGAPGACD